MNWTSIKKLKPDMIHFQEWEGPVEHPWDAAEAYMRRGFLPPVVLCVLLTKSPLDKFTRRRQWVLSGAFGTLKWVEKDYADLRKLLKAVKKRYQA